MGKDLDHDRKFLLVPDCMERSAMRRVDWRWELAQQSRQAQLPTLKELDDTWVQRVRVFQERCEVSGIRPSDPEAAALDSAIHGAYLIWSNPDPLVCAEVEALILAEEPDDVIARRVGCDVDAITAYERVFYNVRERLSIKFYIVNCAIGSCVFLGLTRDDVGPIWKLYGYFFGPVLLDLMMFTLPGPRARPWPDSVPANPEERSRLLARCRLAILVQTLPVATLKPNEVVRLMALAVALNNQETDNQLLKTLTEEFTALNPKAVPPTESECDREGAGNAGNVGSLSTQRDHVPAESAVEAQALDPEVRGSRVDRWFAETVSVAASLRSAI
jgi:hypothetical protein